MGKPPVHFPPRPPTPMTPRSMSRLVSSSLTAGYNDFHLTNRVINDGDDET